jgi:hypothetical protein
MNEEVERRLWLACETNTSLVQVSIDDLRQVLVDLARLPECTIPDRLGSMHCCGR